MNKACAFYEKNGFIRGRIEKYPLDEFLCEGSKDMQNALINRPKPIIFEADAIIPDEDRCLMKMLPSQSKCIYVQHYSLML